MIKNNIPRIRFNNFKAFWVEKKIADIVKISAGGDVDKVKLKESGQYPVIANALTNKGIVGFYDDYKVKAPAVTVTGRGDVGYAVARHENFTPVVRLLTLQSENIDVDYLENQINSMRILNESTGVPQLTAPQLGNYKVYHPEIDEQSVIGSLFSTLDGILASYKDNLANYQSIKVTMLSKMFPKAGQTVPEIRLDGFEDRWEEKYIGELADIVRGASPRPIQDPKWFDSNSEIGWLRISDVTNQNGRIHSLEQKISKLGQEKTRVLTEPHLLLSIAATVGKPVVNYVKTGVHDGFLIFMNPKFDREFMFQWLEMFREKWNRYGQPGSQVNLNSDIVKNQKILIPSMEEQRAIGTYFSNLDNLINSHQKKISQLETLKKKLLQDMFI
ncbi:restriction endonuclease subunit S [Streptococcus infantis]|uniref:restriction endonuclease subunit S n=1 Tax=Streptococcus infantis TaxID=68892 RepID=UPI0039C29B9A